MSTFLDDDAMYELTRKRRHAAQRRALDALGVQYRQRPDGSLAVLHAHVQRIFGAGAASDKVKKDAEPNWDAM